jgi:hypothetical protein
MRLVAAVAVGLLVVAGTARGAPYAAGSMTKVTRFAVPGIPGAEGGTDAGADRGGGACALPPRARAAVS